jgi:hypothetical protein
MGWKSIGVLALVLLTTPMEAVGRDFSRASLVVRIYNNYGVPADDLLAARTQVDAIFSEARIDLSWLECWQREGEPVKAPPTCRQPLGADELTLRLQAPNQSEGKRFVSMGFSLVNLEAGAPFLATIFVDLVTSISRSAAVDFRLLLGRAIAHEIGHLLLNTNRHAHHGIMRADWSRAELSRNNPADWRFVEDEIPLIRSSAMARTTPLSARALP